MYSEPIMEMIDRFLLLASFKMCHFCKTKMEVLNLSVWVSYLYKQPVSEPHDIDLHF